MTTDKILLLTLGLALAAFVACTSDNQPKDSEKMANQANEPKTETARSEDDAQILVEVVSTDYFEIAATDVAKTMARHADVLAFANQMGQMHTTMMNETMALAKRKSFTVPNMMGNDYMDDIEDMKKWSKGKEFDTKYIDAQVDLHQKLLDKLEKLVANAKDTDVKAWAEKAAAGVRKHIEMARAVDAKLDTVYQ